MKFDPRVHHRRSIRLNGFDYSQADSYFVTLVCHQRAELFGEISQGELRLNPAGRIIEAAWLSLEHRFPTIQMDEFIIMPNHLHGTITVGATLVVAPDPLEDAIRAGTSPAPTKTLILGDVIGAFKSISTCEYIVAVQRGELPPFSKKIWQRNYYEHIIRDPHEWDRARRYITENAIRWADDEENPDKS